MTGSVFYSRPSKPRASSGLTLEQDARLDKISRLWFEGRIKFCQEIGGHYVINPPPVSPSVVKNCRCDRCEKNCHLLRL